MSALESGLVAGGGLLSSLLNIGSSHYFTKKQWERDDTAVQRRVNDLVAAGLSPTLAAGSAANSSTPIHADFNGLDFGKNFMLAENQALQNQLLKSQIRSIDTQTDNNNIDQRMKTLLKILGGVSVGLTAAIAKMKNNNNNDNDNDNDNSNGSTSQSTNETVKTFDPNTDPILSHLRQKSKTFEPSNLNHYDIFKGFNKSTLLSNSASNAVTSIVGMEFLRQMLPLMAL